MEAEVKSIFDAWIADKFKAMPDVKAFLLAHPRKQLCIDAVCRQVRIAELSNIGRRFEQRQYKSLVTACAGMFADAVLKHGEEQALSRIERQRRVAIAGYYDEVKDQIKELSDEATTSKLISRPGDVAR